MSNEKENVGVTESDNLGTSNRSQTKMLLPVGLILVVIVVAFLFWWVRSELIPVEPTTDVTPSAVSHDEVVSASDLPNDMFGTLYLATTKIGDKAVDVYKYDIQSGSLDRLFSNDYVRYTAVLSPSGSKIAYTAAPLDRYSRYEFPMSEALQLYINDTADTMETTRDNQVTTSVTGIGTRMPMWSPDEQFIAFTGVLKNEFSLDDQRSWQTYLYNLDSGETQEIALGTAQFWSPDSEKLFFLDRHGLSVYDVSTREIETKIWTYADHMNRDFATVGMHMDISDDHKMLAATNPDHGEVRLFTVTSWNPFTTELTSGVDISRAAGFSWPRFSPDGRYLVVEESKGELAINKVTGNPGTDSHVLVAYDLTNKNEGIVIKSLADFDYYISFVSDWK